MMAGLNPRHLVLIGLSSSRNAIRSGTGIISVFLVFLVGLFIATRLLVFARVFAVARSLLVFTWLFVVIFDYHYHRR